MLTSRQERRIRGLLRRYPDERVQKAVALWPRWFQAEFRSQFQAATKPYITGLSALNIPYRGKQADWHQLGMLYGNKFQVAGRNYDSAPGLGDRELFDCGSFLSRFNVDVGTTLCALPERAVKDILYSSIIRKSRYPAFFMLDQLMLEIPKDAMQAILGELGELADVDQKQLLRQWAHDNELD